MNFLFLYGPPAVGKLTVAQELATLTGYRLFHNHLTVDLVLSVYDFGTPGFIALREEIWFSVIRRALADRLPGLIFTFNPENTVPQRFIDELFAEVSAGGGNVIPIALVAPEHVIEHRIESGSRKQHRKLADTAFYRQLREAGTFETPVIPNPRITVDTSLTSPLDAAARIRAVIET